MLGRLPRRMCVRRVSGMPALPFHVHQLAFLQTGGIFVLNIFRRVMFKQVCRESRALCTNIRGRISANNLSYRRNHGGDKRAAYGQLSSAIRVNE